MNIRGLVAQGSLERLYCSSIITLILVSGKSQYEIPAPQHLEHDEAMIMAVCSIVVSASLLRAALQQFQPSPIDVYPRNSELDVRQNRPRRGPIRRPFENICMPSCCHSQHQRRKAPGRCMQLGGSDYTSNKSHTRYMRCLGSLEFDFENKYSTFIPMTFPYTPPYFRDCLTRL